MKQLMSVWLLTALAPVIWGSTYLVTQNWLPENEPFTAAVLRAIPAGLLLLVWTRQSLSGAWWLKAFTLGALNIGVFFTCLFAAAYLLPGSVAALLLASQPIFVILLSEFWLATPLSLTSVLQALLGVLGVFLLMNPANAELNLLGIVAAMIGAASMATGVVLNKRWQRPSDVSLLGLTGWQLLFGGVLLLPFMFWFEGMPSGFEIQHIVGYSYLTLLGGVLAYSLWFFGIQKLSAVSVSLLGFLSPLTATVLGFWVQGESFGELQWLGAVCILVVLVLPLLAPLKNLITPRARRAFQN